MLFVAAAACLAVLLTGCQQVQPIADVGDELRVTHVSDGDTLRGLDAAGRTVQVRLLGIDAPELAHDGQPAACGASDARDSLRRLVLQQDVTLSSDPRADRTDRYGRRLAYLEVAGVDAGLHQVTAGYAAAWYPRAEPRPARQDTYQEAQRTAQQGRMGAWARCTSLGR